MKFLCLLLTLAISTLAADDLTWKEISNRDGMRVSVAQEKDSSLVAFKGETVMQASIPQIASVLFDTSRKKEWVSDLMEGRVLRQMGPLERVEYNHTATPWPLAHRDFVFQAKAEVDPTARTMLFTLHSIQDPSMPPQPGLVRGELIEGRYLLADLGSGKGTDVTVSILVDPKGWVPKWIVNMVQRGWPQKTLSGIRAQLAKPDVKENALVKAILQGLTPTASLASNP